VTGSIVRSSEAYPRVGIVVELQTRSAGGLRRRTGRAPLPYTVRQGRTRAYFVCARRKRISE
jgi:hypothetical protein